jgi:hypothetical protein
MSQIIFWNTLDGNSYGRPLGPHYLAAQLRIAGYTAKVIDFCSQMSVAQLVSLTEKHIDDTTIAIGVSSTFWNDVDYLQRMPPEEYIAQLGLAKGEPAWVQAGRTSIEEKFPTLDWLLGGANSFDSSLTYMWRKIHGYAEDELIKYMDSATQAIITRIPYDNTKLANVYTDDLAIAPSEILLIEMARGCQFKCRFCSYPGLGKQKNTYIRDTELIKAELLYNYERYGVTRYMIVDDTVNESNEKIIAMAKIAQSLPFKFEWIGYNRLDLVCVNKQSQILRDSGLKSTYFGIESFNETAAKSVGKAWNGTKAKDYILKLMHEWGGDTNFVLGFIAGLPGDTMETLKLQSNWCKSNNIPSWRHAGLTITRNFSKNTWTSEFAKNYTKYGFKFNDPMSESEWESQHWNWLTAMRAAYELNVDAHPFQRVAGLRIAYFGASGLTFDELHAKKVSEIDLNIIDIKRAKFVNDYVAAQLAMY